MVAPCARASYAMRQDEQESEDGTRQRALPEDVIRFVGALAQAHAMSEPDIAEHRLTAELTIATTPFSHSQISRNFETMSWSGVFWSREERV